MRSEAPPSDNIYVTELPAGLDDQTLREIFTAYGTISQCRVLSSQTPGQQGKCAALVRFASLEEATWIVDNLDGNIPQGLTEPIGCRYADTPEMKAQRQQKGGGKVERPSPYGPPPQGRGGYDIGKGYDGVKGFGGGNGFDMGFKGFDGYKGKGFDAKGFDFKGFDGKGPSPAGCKGKGRGKKGSPCTIKVLHDGLLEAECLPGGSGYTNDENALYVANLPGDTHDVDLYKIFAPFGPIAPKGVRAMLNPDGSCKGIGFINYLDPMAADAAVQTLNGTTLPDGTTLIVKVKAPALTGDKGKGKGKGKGDGGKGRHEPSEEDEETAAAFAAALFESYE